MYKKLLIFLIRRTLKTKHKGNNFTDAYNYTIKNEKDMPFIIIVDKAKSNVK